MFVASMNHRPKMWTIHAPNSKWPNCDCPHAQQGIICKHIMKVFKILHPNVPNGVVFKMWVHTMGCTNQLQTLHDHEMVWFLKNKTKMWSYNQLKLWGPLLSWINLPHL